MPDLIRQLTPEELNDLVQTARQQDSLDMLLPRNTLLSLLNEVAYHRGRRATEGVLEVRSLVSMRDGKPYLLLHLGSTEVTLSTNEAIEHARRILQVASGAAADAFLATFVRDKLGLPQEAIGRFLSEFRTYRETTLGEDAPDNLPVKETPP